MNMFLAEEVKLLQKQRKKAKKEAGIHKTV